MKETIQSRIPSGCSWKEHIHWFDTIDSTNTRAKALAAQGAPHGTVLIADRQTAGRGRLGRSFHSASGKGIYLSVILRPGCKPEQLMHLTCATAVAAVTAIERSTGYCPSVKWINDIVAGKSKLGGILAEMSIDTKTQTVEYAVIGIGINCTHRDLDFPEELRSIATSLQTVTGQAPDRADLAAQLITALFEMDRNLLTGQEEMMQRYAGMCITLGQQVVVLRGDSKQYGTALDIDKTGSLCVEYTDGTTEWVCSGEVSVRGMYGYI